MKKNDIVSYTAQAYSTSETVGDVDGVAVFVPRMIVGESASVKINYVKNNVAYGEAVEITERSHERVEPDCKLFGVCGGCSLMHMNYGEQLKFKRVKVENNLRKIAKLDVDVLPCVASDCRIFYRNKLSLPVSGFKGNVRVGMYRKGTHDVVDINDCKLGGEWSVKLVNIFKNFMNAAEIEPYDETDFSGQVRHLVARYVNGQLLVVVVTNGVQDIDYRAFIAELKKSFGVFGLFVNENFQRNNVIMGKTTKHIYGIRYIEGENLGVKFRLRPNSFFQVNDGVKNALYSKIKKLLDLSRTQVLVDCFSGVGLLTNVLADSKFVTYAVEIEPSAVADAKEMQKINGNNIINVCGGVAEELPKITREHKGKILTLVVDPPRKGLGDSVCKTITEADFDNVVYVSCDSATLARDLILLAQKYDVTYVQPFDMFPQTDQIETLVHLSRKKNNGQS